MVMAGENGRSTMGHRILMGFDGDVQFTGGATSTDLADMVFGYFDEEGGESSSSSGSSSCNGIDDEEEEMNLENVAESKAFWEDQQKLLHATLSRTTTLESRIREVTKEALNESQEICFCSKPVTGGCRICIMRKIRDRLQNAGFDSAICKSKWKRSQDIPAGEHTYLDIVEKSMSSKKTSSEIRVIIELGFRAEFEIGRASGEYNMLINRLPEVFVGKAERLKTVVKMLCSAAKKCMKENKMHMGPWRKHRYMQAKWFSTPCQRTVSETLNLPMGFPEYRLVKPKSSTLSFDLAENKLAAVPSSRFQHFTAVVAV